MKTQLGLKNIVILILVVIAIISSLFDMSFIQGLYIRINDRSYFMNDYSHIIFYALFGIFFLVNGINFVRGLLYITLFTISMELLQSFSPSRNVDIDDVITSIAGWTAGYIIYWLSKFLIKVKEER